MTIELHPLDVAHAATLRRLHQQPGVTRWWGPMEDGFPFDEPESIRSAILVDGEVAGMVQWSEEDWAHYRHAWIDIFVGDDYTRRGVGTEVVRRTVRMLIEERGHHRITIDPAVANAAAIRAYEKVGFRAVGVMRRYERDVGGDGWHDGLLMELLAGEEVR
jgi:aminoglycoside 6'-N-acetyltransferase